MSESRFGLDDDHWEAAKTELREAIMESAWDRRMTWYGEVATKVSAVRLEPYSALMNHLLGAILEDEHAAGGPLLTALVTHKFGDKEPGEGFYQMARQLGYVFNEPFVFWSTQVQEIFTLYGKPSRARS